MMKAEVGSIRDQRRATLDTSTFRLSASMMNVFRLCTPRSAYSTKAKDTLPNLARVARTASTPLAVRRRRSRQFGPIKEGTSDSTKTGLTPSEKARYNRLKTTGEIPKDPVTKRELSETEWLAQINARRSRVRGFSRKVRKPTGVIDTEVVGRRIYLPNIVLRLVRNHTPPGLPYNPYEATFRIPQSVTKTDLRSLLLAMYGVKTTYIRTDNYLSPWYRTVTGWEQRPHKTYKRAVVGLVDPFYYPHRLEDMPEAKRKEWEAWWESNFMIHHARVLRKTELLRATKGDGKASYKLKAPYATKRSHILRLIGERREKREGLVASFAKEMKTMRNDKEKIEYEKIKDRVFKKVEATPPADSS
jgi:large subunit ribosomal protein L23